MDSNKLNSLLAKLTLTRVTIRLALSGQAVATEAVMEALNFVTEHGDTIRELAEKQIEETRKIVDTYKLYGIMPTHNGS